MHKLLLFWLLMMPISVVLASDETLALVDALQVGIEDRQSLMNEHFNDESPQWHPRGWPIPNSRFMAIAQGAHLWSDRVNRTDEAWQDRHQHPDSQWTDLVVEGKPQGRWRYFINANLTAKEMTIDEAYITLPLPLSLQVKLGQFYSGFGRLNSQHPHDRDFIDAPLVYDRLFGESSILEKGVQLSVVPWSGLMIGVERLTQINRDQFQQDKASFGLSNLFVRSAQRWGANTEALLGASVAQGERWLSSTQTDDTWWRGVDVTIKTHLADDRYWLLQAEWLQRQGAASAQPTEVEGVYAMLLYRWQSDWRVGVRGEQLAMAETGVDTDKYSLLIEHDPTHWLRTRWQLGHQHQNDGLEGFYAMIGWQASLHWMP